MTALPSHARAVVIGGGIIGCSTAYHLAKLRLARHRAARARQADQRLAPGTRPGWSGSCAPRRTSRKLLNYSVELYDRLEAETGQATGWKRNGGLRLACNAERMTEMHAPGDHGAQLRPRRCSCCRRPEAQKLWPPMDASDLVGAVFLPTDGQASPSDVTQALAKGARMGGVRIVEDCPVTGDPHRERPRHRRRAPPFGDIGCEVVVNCCGQWAREIGRARRRRRCRCTSVQHQYLITEPIAGVPRNLPTLRDPDRLIYFKEEVGGLVMGGYEPNPIAWAVDGIPPGFHFTLLENDWDHFEPMMEQALARVPALATAGIKQMINGPEIVHARTAISFSARRRS